MNIVSAEILCHAENTAILNMKNLITGLIIRSSHHKTFSSAYPIIFLLDLLWPTIFVRINFNVIMENSRLLHLESSCSQALLRLWGYHQLLCPLSLSVCELLPLPFPGHQTVGLSPHRVRSRLWSTQLHFPYPGVALLHIWWSPTEVQWSYR